MRKLLACMESLEVTRAVKFMSLFFFAAFGASDAKAVVSPEDLFFKAERLERLPPRQNR